MNNNFSLAKALSLSAVSSLENSLIYINFANLNLETFFNSHSGAILIWSKYNDKY